MVNVLVFFLFLVCLEKKYFYYEVLGIKFYIFVILLVLLDEWVNIFRVFLLGKYY